MIIRTFWVHWLLVDISVPSWFVYLLFHYNCNISLSNDIILFCHLKIMCGDQPPIKHRKTERRASITGELKTNNNNNCAKKNIILKQRPQKKPTQKMNKTKHFYLKRSHTWKTGIDEFQQGETNTNQAWKTNSSHRHFEKWIRTRII